MDNSATHILYIEDDETLGELVKRRIARHGYQVDVAIDYNSALTFIKTKQYQLLIVDYQLQDITGTELITQLNEQHIFIPTIMVSGQDDIRIAVQSLNLGCLDYLIKDGHSYLELLPLHIKAVLERQELAQQKQWAESETHKAQESLARAQKLAHIGNWEWYVGDETVWWSEEHFEIFGFECPTGINTVTEDKFWQCIHPNDIELVKSMEQKARLGISTEFEYRIFRGDKVVRWIHAINGVDYDQQGLIARYYGTIQDITERKETEYQLMLAQRVFDNTNEGILLADAGKNIISVNPAFSQITGYDKDEIIGKPLSFLKADNGQSLLSQIWKELLGRGFWAGELWSLNQSGEAFPAWFSINLIANQRGETDQYVAIFSDISQHKKAEKIIEYQANYDALTNLPNRNLFNERLNSAIKSAKREKAKLAILFLDLDRFKWVNDTLGHHAGDQLLQETATRLSIHIRETDTVARLGGDEFIILLTNLTKGLDAELIADKILRELAMPYLIQEHEVFVSASIGITVFPDDAKDFNTLFRNADTAMYAAKESGRNRFSFFTSEMQNEAEKRIYLLNELQSAVKNQSFELYYQPILHADSGELYGAEALLRWPHEMLGFVPPSDFIPLAEETGIIQPLGEWVFDTALEQLSEWEDNGYKLHLSVNKSSKQFHGDVCVDDLQKQIDKFSFNASSLTIEITETVLMEQRELLVELLSAYRDLGINLALDDFGTGYSSLNYLRQFPFNILKIDRSFINDITVNKDNATLVETIILMGHNLNLLVLAEGVETEQQKQFLIDCGCDLLQGYLYSPAIPASAFEKQFLKVDLRAE